MASITQRLTICLWFENTAEEAARFYTSVFQNSGIGTITHYGHAGKEFHGQEPGTAMTVSFTLDGQEFVALNGRKKLPFNEAISLVVNCETQEEIDYYWERLADGGEESYCGWLKDRYGVSWQVVPVALMLMLSDQATARVEKVSHALQQMQKLDLAKLTEAFNS